MDKSKTSSKSSLFKTSSSVQPPTSPYPITSSSTFLTVYLNASISTAAPPIASEMLPWLHKQLLAPFIFEVVMAYLYN
ncbi:hypothetical protein P3S67_010388 [Capsicum chacoense]